MIDDPHRRQGIPRDDSERTWSHLRRIAAALDLPPESFFQPDSDAAERQDADRAMPDQALEIMRLFLQIDDAQARHDCLSKIRACHRLTVARTGDARS